KALGTLVTEQMHANLFVASDAFAHFWTAADATNGAIYNIEIALQRGPRDTLNAISVGLFETIPSLPVRTTKVHSGVPTARVHPVVAEIRNMRADLTKSLLAMFWIVAAVWALVTVFDWLRP